MKSDEKKSEILQIRLTELEKTVIKDKAELLGLSLTDYIKECCIFNNTTAEFIKKLHEVTND